jgi:hypothetical protein
MRRSALRAFVAISGMRRTSTRLVPDGGTPSAHIKNLSAAAGHLRDGMLRCKDTAGRHDGLSKSEGAMPA